MSLIGNVPDSNRAYDLASTDPEWLFFHCLQFIDNRAFFNRLTRVNKAHHDKMIDKRLSQPNSPFLTHILTERFKLTDFQVEGLKKNPEYATDTVKSCRNTIDQLWSLICGFNKDVLESRRKDYDLPILLQQYALDYNRINALPIIPNESARGDVVWDGFYNEDYRIHNFSENTFVNRSSEHDLTKTSQSYIPFIMEAGRDAESVENESDRDDSDDDCHDDSDVESNADSSDAFHDVTKSTGDNVIDSEERDGDDMHDDDRKVNEDESVVAMSDEDADSSSSEDKERVKLIAKMIANDQIDVDERDWPNLQLWPADSRSYPSVIKTMQHLLPVSLFMSYDDAPNDHSDSDCDSDGNENLVPTQQIGLWTGGVPKIADFEQVYASVDFTHVTDHSLADVVEQAHGHFSRSLPIIHAHDLTCNECDTSPIVGALFKCVDKAGDSHDFLCDQCHSQRASSTKQYRVFLGDWLHSLPTSQPITLDESPIMAFEAFSLAPTLSALSTRDFFLSVFGFVRSDLPKVSFPKKLDSTVRKWLGVVDKEQSVGAAATEMRRNVVDALRREYWQNVILLGYMKTVNDTREIVKRDQSDPLWKPLKEKDFEGIESDDDSDYEEYHEYDPERIDGVDPEWGEANALTEQETNDIQAALAAHDMLNMYA